MNKWRQLPKSWFFIPVLLWLIVFTVFDAKAGDWKAGIFFASEHSSSQYTCDAIGKVDYNEENPGFWVSYNGFFVGRYENSVSNCPGFDYSNVLGYERTFYRYQEFSVSYALGMADGYFDDEITGGYRAWASINLKVSIYKLWYGGRAAVHSLEFDF